jgi:hypothetical protein
MESILEGDNGRAPRSMSGDFNRILHGLGTTVEEKGLLMKISRSDGIESLSQLNVRFIHYEHKAGMNIFFNLLLNGHQDFFRTVAGIGDPDSPRKVNIFLAFYISENRAVRPFHEYGVNNDNALGDVAVSFGQKKFIGLHFSASILPKILSKGNSATPIPNLI